MPQFNLVDEPWIPVQTGAGAREVSLREALLNAAQIHELFDPSPPVTASLHRLLLAVLHAAYRGPRSMPAWAALWQREGFDPAIVGSYLDAWAHRFDLFDPVRPFYQRLDMETVKAPSSVLRLLHDSAAGNSQPFWDHTAGDGRALSAAEAARAVVTQQGYAFGGGVCFPFNFHDAPQMRGVTVLARSGENLFRTLLLNLVVYNETSPFPRKDDLPVWEQETEQFAVPDLSGTTPRGYLDFLTFQARALRLIADEQGQVRECWFRQNLVLKDELGIDPFKAYRAVEKLGLRPLTFSVGRSVWRDSFALFATTPTDHSRQRPGVLDHLDAVDELSRHDEIEGAQPRYAVDVLGMCTEPGKAIVHYWRQERLPLPLAYLHDDDLQGALARALQAAQDGVGALRRAVRDLSRLVLQPRLGEAGVGDPDPKTTRALEDGFATDLLYWRRLDLAFDGFLDRLAADGEAVGPAMRYGVHELPRWAEEVRIAARAALGAAIDAMDVSTRALRAAAEAAQRLDIGLYAALKSIEGIKAAV
jgi:CRISPR system Cascade subunit CasA